MIKIDRKVVSHFDYFIPLVSAPIIMLSIFLNYEVNPALVLKQIIYISLTLFLGFLIFIIPLRRFIWLIPIYYYLTLLLLILVRFIGVEKFGARRWLDIPLFGLSFQPSEFIKSSLILMLAYCVYDSPPPREGYGLKQFIKLSLIIVVPCALIKMQPDLGTAILVFFMGFGLLFIVGINKKIIFFVLGTSLIALPLVYANLAGYQKKRIVEYLSDKPQYQVQQSIIAIGSGGLFGKSKEEATQAQLKFLPVPESDFIYAYLMERFGFIGGFVVLSLYCLLIFHLFSISVAFKKDRIIQVVSVSLGLLIFLHTSINIAMTIKLVPVVGIPLPFFSYGGSSFVTFGVLFGLIENLLTFRISFGSRVIIE